VRLQDFALRDETGPAFACQGDRGGIRRQERYVAVKIAESDLRVPASDVGRHPQRLETRADFLKARCVALK
jgi:hypothetical protein